MSKMIIVNAPEEMVGDLDRIPEEKMRAFGLGAQRILWYAENNDVVVLPSPPTPGFMAYVTALTGVDAASLRIVVPPPGRWGSHILTGDRLLDPIFHTALKKAIADDPVDHVVCTYSDLSITGLASAVGIEGALPGFAFSAQGGDSLANSKTVFRAVAAGNGIPIAPGVITDRPEHAENAITSILDQGFEVMAKQQFAGGGLGNEILSRSGNVRAAGAGNVVVLPTGWPYGAMWRTAGPG